MGTSEPVVKVGDEVYVFGWGHRTGSGPMKATVTRVGRTLCDIGRQTYRLDTQHLTGKFGSNYWFRTPGQYASEQRRDDAMTRLKAAGIEFRLGYRSDRYPAEALEAILDAIQPWIFQEM